MGRIAHQKREMDAAQRQREELESVSARFSSLISAFDAFEAENEENARRIEEHFALWWAHFEARWPSWAAEDMISWFKHKTGDRDDREICDWNAVRKAIEKRNIRGKSLQNFSASTIDLIGIYDFDTAHHLRTAIATLRRVDAKSEGATSALTVESDREVPTVPSRFVCPRTGQIMRDPVIASDGKVYEREAVHVLSGDAKERALKPYPQRHLRREIEAFLQKNEETAEGAQRN